MNRIIYIFLELLVVSIPGIVTAQDNISGSVDYEVMKKRADGAVPSSNIFFDNGRKHVISSADPYVLNTHKLFTFNSTHGKLRQKHTSEQRRPPAMIYSMPGNHSLPRKMHKSIAFIGEIKYFDFLHKRILRAFRFPDNDTTFYVVEKLKTAIQFHTTGRTKKIAGYKCHKATAWFQNDTYTLWYTDAIPITFSPVNGLIPPEGGFVLAIKGSYISYKATKLNIKPVPKEDIQIPQPSVELSADEMRDRQQKAVIQLPNG